MKVLGLTGGSGSGKTTALKLLAAQGGLVLDCDAIYHQLLETEEDLLLQIENRFPGVVKQGRLDRKALGERVFHDPVALMDLNGITHSFVHDRVIRRLEESDAPFAAIDAIGLFESGLNTLCDATIAVVAPVEQRIKRLMEREAITREYAGARLAAQKKDEEYCEFCDYTLQNDSTPEVFAARCNDLFRKLLGGIYHE